MSRYLKTLARQLANPRILNTQHHRSKYPFLDLKHRIYYHDHLFKWPKSYPISLNKIRV